MIYTQNVCTTMKCHQWRMSISIRMHDESWRWCDVEVMDDVEIMGESAKSPLLNDSSALYVIQMPKLNAKSTLTTSTPIISYRMKSCKPEQKE